MPLTGPDIADLVEAIADHFEYVELKNTLRRGGKSLQRIVSAEKSTIEVADALVENAMQQLWLAKLLELLLAAREDQPVFVRIKAVVDADAPPPSIAGLAPHERYLLYGNLPFLDRGKFRSIVQHLNKPGQRILTVRGGSGTGKTYSKEFIFHLAAARKADKTDMFQPVWVDLAPPSAQPSGQLVDGLFVITEIVNQISGIELPEKYETAFTEQKEQAARWARNVGSWLTGALVDSEETYWVVIDSFNKRPVADSAKLLIDDLIFRVANNLSALRLILLGYDDDEFKALSVRRHEDETKDLTDPRFQTELYEELGEFLMQANARAYAELEKSTIPVRLADEMQQLLRNIDPSVAGQMKVLAQELEAKVNSLGEDGQP